MQFNYEFTSTGSFFGAKNSNITIRMDRHNVVLVAPECWCPTDIIQLFRAISIFGIAAHTVCMDASIFEMITAGISTILIQDRFSLRDEFMNRLRFLPHLREVVIACVRCCCFQLTLNVPLKELRCLSRISGYGLCPERIFERRALSICRLCLPSTNRPSPASDKNKISNRSINGHVNTFKRWIDATSLKERYCQHYY
ncbi:unnamed protein product [Anisakis simplex]|uniref:Isochorismatase domain-containing protein n=1 Tax=Anisakis simplex TaxID=6269 RepID=A0A0M3J6E7_ANISI|nr:unnamed protein product [Anisakis simplex]